MLLRNPLVTAIAVIALTLGIGANTAIFSVVNAILLGALPYKEPDQLATVWERKEDRDQNVINLANFNDWKQQNNVFSDMALFLDLRVNVVGDGPPEEVPGQLATPNLLTLLGTNALRGRTFVEDDVKTSQPSVVVLSYGLWQRRFGGDENIIGRSLTLNNQQFSVIGVMPENFGWHVARNSRTGKPAEMWFPWRIPNELIQRHGRFAAAVARLKPGVSLPQAQADMDTIAARLRQQYPDFNTGWGVNVVPLRTQFAGEIRKPLLILLGAVAFVLLIACANVANLLLARAASRKKEIAVRAGLGASRLRIVRQLLTESVMLSAIGGVCGLVLAAWGTRVLIAIAPPTLPGLQQVGVNLKVLAFTLGVSCLTGILFGLVPAFEAARFNLQETLKEGSKNIGGHSRGHKLRNTFVVTQVALALVLLIGAGLLLKSLNRLQSVDPGFNPKNLLTMRVNLPFLKYDSDQKIIAFFKRSVEEVSALPGVQAATAIDSLPFTTLNSGTSIQVEGQPVRPPGQSLSTGVVVTDDHYFDAMQIPLKRGRSFTSQETSEMRHVVVVNEAFVRTNLVGLEPIGQRVTINMKDENIPSEIIGVVGDSKQRSLEQQTTPMAYWPLAELPNPSMTIAVRTQVDATSVAASARGVISRIDPDQPVSDVRDMESLLAVSVARSRFSTTLLIVFGIVALVMAVVGVYGVMSYSVLQRTHEIGVRVALGAQQGDVLKLIIKQGVIMGLLGVIVGLAASFGLTRVMQTLLFEVEATDKAVFALVALGSFLTTLLACCVPAVRAARVDPLKALRYE
jgi:putative ABC transport system permease protein